MLSGRMGEAIEMTQTLYPGLLERDQNLLFVLKCRQFVEMVSGNDSEVRPSAHSPRSSPNVSPTHSYGGGSLSTGTNGLVSNGVDNGVTDVMEVEDNEDSSNGSILNGDTMSDDNKEGIYQNGYTIPVSFTITHCIVYLYRNLFTKAVRFW